VSQFNLDPYFPYKRENRGNAPSLDNFAAQQQTGRLHRKNAMEDGRLRNLSDVQPCRRRVLLRRVRLREMRRRGGRGRVRKEVRKVGRGRELLFEVTVTPSTLPTEQQSN
jgi:hypothetical protein